MRAKARIRLPARLHRTHIARYHGQEWRTFLPFVYTFLSNKPDTPYTYLNYSQLALPRTHITQRNTLECVGMRKPPRSHAPEQLRVMHTRGMRASLPVL